MRFGVKKEEKERNSKDSNINNKEKIIGIGNGLGMKGNKIVENGIERKCVEMKGRNEMMGREDIGWNIISKKGMEDWRIMRKKECSEGDEKDWKKIENEDEKEG